MTPVHMWAVKGPEDIEYETLTRNKDSAEITARAMNGVSAMAGKHFSIAFHVVRVEVKEVEDD